MRHDEMLLKGLGMRQVVKMERGCARVGRLAKLKQGVCQGEGVGVWMGEKRGGRSEGWVLYILPSAPQLQRSGDWHYCGRRQYFRAKDSSLTI